MRLRNRRGVPILVLCITAAVARITIGPQIVDDAYITMRYSRNLSAGAMSYNPPDPVLGTSTPLWTWMLTGGNLAGMAPETTAVGAAFLADVCSIVLILASPAGGSLAALAAAATIAAWPAYVAYAVSGMETSPYVLTIVAFVTALSGKRTVAAAVAASLGALCRPDGALLVVLGLIWVGRTQSRTAVLRFMAAATAVGAPWAVYALGRFGSVIPASVSAKAAASEPWFVSFQNLQAHFFHGIYGVLTLFALAGLAAIWMSRRCDCPLFPWSVWAGLYVVVMTAANGFTHFSWYFTPLLPIYTAAAAAGAAEAARLVQGGWHFFTKGGWHLSRHGGWHLLGEAHADRHFSRQGGWHLVGEGGWHLSRQGARHRTWRGAISAAATQGVTAGVLGAVLLSRMPSLKAHLDAASAGREKLYAAVATQLAAVDAHCTVAATEIGTIGYHYPGRVLDLVGLVSPEVVGRPVDTVLTESQARWLVTYDTHFSRAVAESQQFSTTFERRTTMRVSDERVLEVYERRHAAPCTTP
jgi:hypothetical protein